MYEKVANPPKCSSTRWKSTLWLFDAS